jgi:hypothetical protein
MSTSYPHTPLLYKIFIGTVLLLAGAANSVGAETGLNSKGDYDDGKVVWSAISSKNQTYEQAVAFCQHMTNSGTDGVKWELPTTEQMKGFYLNTVNPKVKSSGGFYGWSLGKTWLATEVARDRHEVANLANGSHDWYGQPDTQGFLVTCVAAIGNHWYDRGSNMTWLKVNAESKIYSDAKKYCQDLKDGSGKAGSWKIPTYEQLEGFASSVVAHRKDALKIGGWALGGTWAEAREPDRIHPYGS